MLFVLFGVGLVGKRENGGAGACRYRGGGGCVCVRIGGWHGQRFSGCRMGLKKELLSVILGSGRFFGVLAYAAAGDRGGQAK